MKNIINKLFVLILVAGVFQGCTKSDSKFNNDPTTGWIEFQGSGSSTISLVTEQLALPLDINVPIYSDGLTVNYSIEAVEGDFSQILDTGSTVFLDPESDFRSGSVVLNFSNLDQLTDVVAFDVVLTSTDVLGVSIGVDSESVTRFRVSTPCPIVLANSYNGTESLYNGSPAPIDFTSTVTVVSAEDNIYSLDTVWGPEFISVLCGGCVPVGDYTGPITFQIDPATFDVEILSGGEPSGVGNTFDIAYTVAGDGTFDSCGNIFTLNMTQTILTTNGVPGTVDVILTAN